MTIRPYMCVPSGYFRLNTSASQHLNETHPQHTSHTHTPPQRLHALTKNTHNTPPALTLRLTDSPIPRFPAVHTLHPALSLAV